MIMIRVLVLPFALLASLCLAQDLPRRSHPALPEPAVRTEDRSPLLSFGKVRLDPQKRTVTLPARVNLTAGILEFALVHETGKIHESLFITSCSAVALNTALKLLGVERAREEHAHLPGSSLTENPQTKDAKEAGPPALAPLAPQPHLAVTVTWEDPQKGPTTMDLRQFISLRQQAAPLPALRWLYTGSYFHGSRFLAQVEGDLIAIYASRSALINLDHPEAQDDEVWTVLPAHLPPFNHPVQITLALKPSAR